MSDTIEACDVAYSFRLPAGVPNDVFDGQLRAVSTPIGAPQLTATHH